MSKNGINRRQLLAGSITATAKHGCGETPPGRLVPESVFPVVEALESVRLPGIFADGHDQTGFAQQLQVKPDVGTVLCVGTGRQLADRVDSVLMEIQKHQLIYEDYATWKRQLRVMTGIILDFLRPFPSCPSVLMGHVLTWTDRYVARYYGAQFDHQGPPGYVTPDPTHPITLRFDDAPARRLTLVPRLLEDFWLAPSGVERADTGLLKISHDVSIERGYRPLFAPYTEQLGLVANGLGDQALLAQGIHPAKADLLHSVWHDPWTGQRALRPVSESYPGSGRTSAMTCIDSAGVLDLYTLKILRLFLEPAVPDEQSITFDELSFALERKEGRIVSIAASSDLLANAYLGQPFEQYALGQWMVAHI